MYSTNAVGHRLLLINEGRVEQIGTTLEVCEKPTTLFGARFIGSPSINLIPVRLDPSGNQVILGESLSLPLNNFENIVNGDSTVTLGMRPEHLEDCETENALIFFYRWNCWKNLVQIQLFTGALIKLILL